MPMNFNAFNKSLRKSILFRQLKRQMIHSLNHLAHTLKIAKDELLSLVNNDNISKYYQEYEILKFHSDGQPKNR